MRSQVDLRLGVFQNPPAVPGDEAYARGTGIKGGSGQSLASGECRVKGVGESGLAEVVEQPAEALDLGGFGFRYGCSSEFRGIDGFREFVKDGQDDVESADVTGISDKVEGGRLRRGHGKHAGVAFAGLERSRCEIPFPEKADGKTRQSERPFLPGDYDLELLDLLVGSPMQGGGAQETDVVGQV